MIRSNFLQSFKKFCGVGSEPPFVKLFLAGHIVVMVTYFAAKLTTTCSPMAGPLFDSLILASTDIEWL